MLISCELIFVFSCQPDPKKTSPLAPPSSKSQQLDASGQQQSPQAGKAGDKGAADPFGGGLDSIFGGLMGGKGASGGGGLPGGAQGGQEGGPSGDPSQILPVQRFGTPYLSFQLHAATKNYLNQSSIEEGKNPSSTASPYHCPGDSFWVGSQSFYDIENADRIYQERCQFLEDGLGRPLKKQNCTLQQANDFEQDFDFICPKGSLLAGHQSIYSSDKKDRRHKFVCCEAVTEEGKKVDFLEQKVEGTEDVAQICEQSIVARMVSLPQFATRDVNPERGSVEFKCQGKIDTAQGPVVVGSIVRNVYATYWDRLKDRIFSFECCVLGVVEDAPQGNPGQ